MRTLFLFFLGSWQGTGGGQPGTGRYERSYEVVLNEKYISVRNRSTYPPQEQNPNGEIHEDWGLSVEIKYGRPLSYANFTSKDL